MLKIEGNFDWLREFKIELLMDKIQKLVKKYKILSYIL